MKDYKVEFSDIKIQPDWKEEFYEKYKIYPMDLIQGFVNNGTIGLVDCFDFISDPTEDNFKLICEKADKYLNDK